MCGENKRGSQTLRFDVKIPCGSYNAECSDVVAGTV